VRPGERDAHDGEGEQNRRDEVAEGQPPSGEKQPYDVADHPQRAGADIFATDLLGDRNLWSSLVFAVCNAGSDRLWPLVKTEQWEGPSR
jgi:hypothetical protein